MTTHFSNSASHSRVKGQGDRSLCFYRSRVGSLHWYVSKAPQMVVTRCKVYSHFPKPKVQCGYTYQNTKK